MIIPNAPYPPSESTEQFTLAALVCILYSKYFDGHTHTTGL